MPPQWRDCNRTNLERASLDSREGLRGCSDHRAETEVGTERKRHVLRNPIGRTGHSPPVQRPSSQESRATASAPRARYIRGSCFRLRSLFVACLGFDGYVVRNNAAFDLTRRRTDASSADRRNKTVFSVSSRQRSNNGIEYSRRSKRTKINRKRIEEELKYRVV